MTALTAEEFKEICKLFYEAGTREFLVNAERNVSAELDPMKWAAGPQSFESFYRNMLLKQLKK